MSDGSTVEKQDFDSTQSSRQSSYINVYAQASGGSSPSVIPEKVRMRVESEGLVVNSEGKVSFPPFSPAHPRQWPLKRKLYDTIIIVLLEFITTTVSNSGSNLGDRVSVEIGASKTSTIFYLTTVYLIGQAIGGLLFAPIVENFGGKFIYVCSSAVYTAMCLVLGLAPPSIAGIVVARFVSGLASAMPSLVATGSVEDIWDARARVWGISSWAVGGILGMAIGPIYAVYVSSSDLGWRWVFNGAAIAMGVMTFLSLEMRESRPNIVLSRKVASIRARTGYKELQAEGEATIPGLREFACSSLSLPARLFFTEPLVCVTTIMGATVVSLIYLFAQALPIVYVDDFGLSEKTGALVFLIIGAGILITFLSRCYDMHVANKCIRANRPMEPEDKLSGILLSAPLLAVGLFWFAGTVPPLYSVHNSPVPSMIPTVFVGFASVEFDYVLSGYLTDTYQARAASANAPMGCLRALVSGVYPLVGDAMYGALGASNATFILAAVATVYGVVALVFKRYGRAIRQRSQSAAANSVS